MKNLQKEDPQIYKVIKNEEVRTSSTLELIPSNNYPSPAVLEALGSILNYKYSEGYPKKRYYQGQKFADEAESIAIERAKALFGVPHANVQPYSGSPANTAVYFALLEPLKDTIMGLNLAHGGHLTHGSPVSFSGKYFKVVSYGLDEHGLIDYKKAEQLAVKTKPKIIVCGATAYPRIIDFEKFGKIADEVGAYLLADISHIAGLVAAGVHPSPVKHAHIIMTTTHKTLRGPRGAMLMVTDKGLKKDPELAEKIDKAVFPGLQGGPNDNQTAAIAVALKEASRPEFLKYAEQIVLNARTLAQVLINNGFQLISGGTDNHLLLIDLRNKGVNGAIAAYALEIAGIIVNKNAVPDDSMPPFYPSGIRLGTPALTTRRMKEKEMEKVGDWIRKVIEQLSSTRLPGNREERSKYFSNLKKELSENSELMKIAEEVKKFTSKFPLP